MSTKSLTLPANIRGFLVRLPRRLFERLLKKDSLYRNMAQFSRMDDRMLRDMGVSRQDRDRELNRHTVWFVPGIHR